jgi:hypothetical protein
MQQKYFNFLGAALLASTSLMLSAGSAAAVDGWVMKCRGGGNMQAVTTWTARGNIIKTEVFFTRATVGSNTRQPAAGNCAWEDRGINASEPGKLAFVSSGGIEMRCSQRQCDAVASNPGTLKLQTYVQSGAPFSVLVHNTAGTFQIMQILN